MYRIPRYYNKRTGKKLEDIYYDRYLQKFRDAIRKKRSKRTWKIGHQGQKGKKIQLIIEAGSKADLFLEKCLNDDAFFKSLIAGEISQLINIYKTIDAWVADPAQMTPLSTADFLSIYNLQQSGQCGPVCIFLYAIKHVFVDGLYEGELEKAWVDKRLGLDYCPYCGNEETSFTVFNHAVNGQTVLKPELDHFLPKSLYPFFAVSFFNLVPSCNTCNHKDLKGDYNPLSFLPDGSYLFSLMNPYYFDDKEVTFAYIPPVGNQEVEIKCIIPNANLNMGYNQILAIESRYSHHRDEVRDMNERMNNYLELSIRNYGKETYRFEPEFLRLYPTMVLGFNPADKKPRKKQRFKFLKDVFTQMTHDYGI